MKKWLKITLLMVLAVIVVSVVWIVDNTRIVEKPLDEVVEIAKSIDGEDISGVYAYTLLRSEDKIIHTYYFAEGRTKIITTYYIENGVVTKAYKANHYTTKLSAKRSEDDFVEKKVNGNVVEGWANLSSNIKGKTASELYNELEAQSTLICEAVK